MTAGKPATPTRMSLCDGRQQIVGAVTWAHSEKPKLRIGRQRLSSSVQRRANKRAGLE
jgi:hypothetical protein